MKTVHIMTDPAVSVEATYPIYQAFTDILDQLNIRIYFELHDLGPWKAHGYQNGNKLVAHKSVNWYLERAYEDRIEKSLNLLNTKTLTSELQVYALINRVDYTIFITDKPTNHPEEHIGLTNGATAKYRNVIFSLSCIDRQMLYNLAMHEYGHLFGLILDTSRPHLAKDHCNVNYCIMKPFTAIKDVVHGFDSFCPHCLSELQEFAKHVKTSS